MPEENEELEIFADNATNESDDLDVTQFANPEPVCEPVVELHEDYVIAKVEDGGEYKEYAVPKAWVNEEGLMRGLPHNEEASDLLGHPIVGPLVILSGKSKLE